MRYLVYRWHKGYSGFAKLKQGQSVSQLVGRMQKSHYRYIWGHTLPGITYQVYEGDLVGAMVASSKL
jgi:hypothetical protein